MDFAHKRFLIEDDGGLKLADSHHIRGLTKLNGKISSITSAIEMVDRFISLNFDLYSIVNFEVEVIPHLSGYLLPSLHHAWI